MTKGAILALDLGTQTGWAISTPGGHFLQASGSQSFKLGRFEGGGIRYLRFSKFLTTLNDLSGPFGLILFEEVRRHIGTDAAHVYGGLMATLTAWCEARDIPYEGIPIGTWKKRLTGSGAASKQKVAEAIDRLQIPFATQDEADAIGVLLSQISEPETRIW